MNIIPTTKTAMLSDLRRQLTLDVAEATHHLAVVIDRANQTVWNLETADLLAFLNADLSATKAMLENSHALATAANKSLEEIAGLVRLDGSPMFPARAPTVRGRADIVFDAEQGQWICLPPPPADPQPEDLPPAASPE